MGPGVVAIAYSCDFSVVHGGGYDGDGDEELRLLSSIGEVALFDGG